MDSETVTTRLRAHRVRLEQLGVKSLALFGSVARDEATLDSDVDLLVDFSRPVGLFEFVRLQLALEEILGCRVDLGTPDSLRASSRVAILEEAVDVTP